VNAIAMPPPDVEPRNGTESPRESKRGVERRFAKLTAQRHALEDECSRLRAENAQLQGDFQRAVTLVEKFRTILRKKKESAACPKPIRS